MEIEKKMQMTKATFPPQSCPLYILGALEAETQKPSQQRAEKAL